MWSSVSDIQREGNVHTQMNCMISENTVGLITAPNFETAFHQTGPTCEKQIILRTWGQQLTTKDPKTTKEGSWKGGWFNCGRICSVSCHVYDVCRHVMSESCILLNSSIEVTSFSFPNFHLLWNAENLAQILTNTSPACPKAPSGAKAGCVIVLSLFLISVRLKSIWCLVHGHGVYRGEVRGLVLTPWDSSLCSYLSLLSVANPYALCPCDV